MTEIFAVPCNHEDCASKLFYMKYDPLSVVPDSSYYMLADTKKLIAQIERDDPEMIDHALAKYDEGSAEKWLENNSERKPHSIGIFAFSDAVNWEGRLSLWQKIKYRLRKLFSDESVFYSNAPALTLSQGRAEGLALIQKLNLPYVPIAVHKSYDDPEGHIEQLQRLVGVDPVQEARAA